MSLPRTMRTTATGTGLASPWCPPRRCESGQLATKVSQPKTDDWRDAWQRRRAGTGWSHCDCRAGRATQHRSRPGASYHGNQLMALTRLWAYAPFLPPADRLPMPPWDAPGGRDDLLGTGAMSSNENTTPRSTRP